jgi:hypothetical protein
LVSANAWLLMMSMISSARISRVCRSKAPTLDNFR